MDQRSDQNLEKHLPSSSKQLGPDSESDETPAGGWTPVYVVTEYGAKPNPNEKNAVYRIAICWPRTPEWNEVYVFFSRNWVPNASLQRSHQIAIATAVRIAKINKIKGLRIFSNDEYCASVYRKIILNSNKESIESLLILLDSDAYKYVINNKQFVSPVDVCYLPYLLDEPDVKNAFEFIEERIVIEPYSFLNH